jgi:hypothetical protein
MDCMFRYLSKRTPRAGSTESREFRVARTNMQPSRWMVHAIIPQIRRTKKKTHTNAMPYGSILVFPLRPSRSRPYEPTMVDPATDQRHERCCQKWTDLTGRSSRPLPAQITVAEGLAATYRVEEIGSRWPEGKWCSRSRFCARSVGKGSLRVGWRGVGRQPAVGSTD